MSAFPRILASLLRFVPINVLYFKAGIVYVFLYYVMGYRKKVVRKNLKNAFPELSQKELHRIEKRFYRHFSDYFFESLALLNISHDEIRKRFKLSNPSLLFQYDKQRMNVILAVGHYGNWEWFAHLMQLITCPGIAIYKKQSNAIADDFLKKARSRFGVKMMQYHETYRYILNMTREENCMIYFLADQKPGSIVKAEWIRFMNQDTPVFRGLENLQKKLNGIVCYVHVKKVARGYYEAELIPLNESGETDIAPSLTERYFAALEKNTSEDPAYYLWSHNRWKFTHPTRNTND
jgi:KDO2-lipid IV(A) lauroyltransferase